VLSKPAVLSRVQELVAQGWTSLPVDDPTLARRGFVVFRHVERLTGIPVSIPADLSPEVMENEILEESQTLEYNIFDKPLQSRILDVDPTEMIAAMKADPTYYCCDDPMKRLLGFVWYKVDEGVAEVRYTRLTQFKAGSEEEKAFIQAEKTRLNGVKPQDVEPQPATP